MFFFSQHIAIGSRSNPTILQQPYPGLRKASRQRVRLRPARAASPRRFDKTSIKTCGPPPKIELYLVLYLVRLTCEERRKRYSAVVELRYPTCGGKTTQESFLTTKRNFQKLAILARKNWQHFPRRRQNVLTRNTAHLTSFWIFGKICHQNALRFYSNPSQQQQQRQGANGTPALSMEKMLAQKGLQAQPMYLRGWQSSHPGKRECALQAVLSRV